MTALDKFRLDGKVVIIPGGGGGIGSALACGLASAGADVAIVERTRELGRAGGREGARRGLPLPDAVRRHDQGRGRRPGGGRDHRRAGPPRRHHQRHRRRGRQGAVPGPRVPPRRLGLDLRAERARQPAAHPGGGAGHDRRRARRAGAEHLLGAGRPRHQRRLLGLRGGQGGHQLPHPPDGHRVGALQDHRQRHRPHVRGHPAGGHAARGPQLQEGRRLAHPAGAGWARPKTSSARCCSSAPRRPRSSPARSCTSTEG